MKRLLMISGLLLVFNLPMQLHAQAKADRITGFYFTSEKDTLDENSQVKIYKGNNGKYFGELVWISSRYESDGKEKVDKHNPDSKLRCRKLLGLQILKNFIYDEKADEWSGGTIYNPETGKTYNSFMKLEGNTLKLRGYIGKSWMGLGKTTVWVKEETQRK